MKIERAILVLQDARAYAVNTEKLYRETAIPAAQKELDSAIAQAVEAQERIVEIDRLLKLAEINIADR